MNITMSFMDCAPNENQTRWCDYGIRVNQQMMEVISGWGPLIYAGCFAATISSAIASLVGAPRVLQALAKDKLYPYIEFFQKGYGGNNDPIRGYVLVFIIALICILIGDLNVVSSLLSNFFVAAYALINFSVFHSSVTKSPGWRPAFKYYNMWVSLIGTVLCVVVMFLMDHVTALVTFIIIICLYVYVSIRKPNVNWGSSTQAQSFVNALKTTQGLTKVDDHVKNYRPKIIVLTGDPETRPCLIDFANLITKRISLLTTTNIISNNTADWKSIENLKKRSQQWLTENKIKAFHTIARNDSFSEGVRATLELHGLGKLSPNMVMLGFKEDWNIFPNDAEEYFKVLQSAFEMNLSVGILRVSGGMDISAIVGAAERIGKFMPRSESHLSLISDRSDRLPDEIYAPPSELSMGSIYAPPSSIYAPNSSIYAAPSEASQCSIYSPYSIGSIYSPASEMSIGSNGTSRDSGLYLDVSQLGKSVESGLNVSGEKRKRKRSKMVMPTSLSGVNIDESIIDKMVQFRDKKNMEGTVDIYWLYDDGGLTLLIPHILITRAKFSKCKLRVFFLCSKKHEVVKETMNMVKLLSKFRIEADDVIIIDDATKKPRAETKDAFDKMVRNSGNSPSIVINDTENNEQVIPEDVLSKHKEKTNFHLRISEVVREHSSQASLVVMTLPMVRKGHVSPLLYLAWLDMLTQNMPPCLLVRGNQTSVLTFYS
jgi:solute carrier family 12 sodium/potassium/chloride transporter 2